MNTDTNQLIFTIGHSNLEFAKFVALLQPHGIQVVADVRTSPYSQYNPHFNREPLQRALRKHGIRYVFFGVELGARRSEPECYVDGRADYALISRVPAFTQGIDRLIRGAANMRIAVMCAEKDPLECHRCILVSPHLRDRGLRVLHILTDGSLESHEEAEKRLVHLFELQERDLFRTADEIVAEAYKMQSDRIAYQEDQIAP
jgi:uncharacterized protein (DUF488 family)